MRVGIEFYADGKSREEGVKMVGAEKSEVKDVSKSTGSNKGKKPKKEEVVKDEEVSTSELPKDEE